MDQIKTTYEVGNKVAIKANLVVGESYGGIEYESEMDELKDEVFLTIKEVDKDGTYRLNKTCGDDYDFWYSAEMLMLA